MNQKIGILLTLTGLLSHFPTLAVMNCTESWTFYGNKCYRNFAYSLVSWQTAETVCLYHGGHLASISTSGENQLVHGLGLSRGDSQQLWIGLRVKGVKIYTWSDGTPYSTSYNNWDAGKPSNNGQCVQLDVTQLSDKWGNVSCNVMSPFVCETDPPICAEFVLPPLVNVVYATRGGVRRAGSTAYFSCIGGAELTGCAVASCFSNSSWSCAPPTCTYSSGEECGYGGWSFWNGGCYKLFNATANWNTARQTCLSFSADLVSIRNIIENDLAYGMSISNSPPLDTWIGLSDVHQDGVFTWADGEGVNYTAWASLQPVDTPSNQDCGYMNSAQSPTWSTDTCANTRAYVCKKIINKATCPAGWKLHKNKCYKVYSSGATQQEAENECITQSGHLASISSGEENLLIASFQLKIYLHFWIGLKVNNVSEDRFSWSDGTDYSSYINWNSGQPSGDTDCVEMLIGTGTEIHGRWNDIPCDKKSPFVCEKEAKVCPALVVPNVVVSYSATKGVIGSVGSIAHFCCMYVGAVAMGANRATCLANSSWSSLPPVCVFPSSEECGSDGWTAWNRNCYKAYTSAVTWASARQTCLKQSGDLVAIHTAEEGSLVYGLAHTTSPNTKTWIGLTDFGQDGVFSWSDGSPLNYTSWASQPPPNIHGSQDCSFTRSSDSMWSTGACNALSPFVCKRSTSNWYCKDWETFGNSCYKFVVAQVSWDTAQESCNNTGAKLVTIESKCENAFVYKLATSPYWIGLSDTRSEGEFLWVDGQSVEYSDWLPGEPNDNCYDMLGEDCVGIRQRTDSSDGLWNDNPCHVPKSYVCEKAQRCPSLFPVPNGRIVVDDVTVGSMAIYSCNNGFRLKGAYTRTCECNGDWSGPAPSCEIVDCGTIPVNGVNVAVNTSTFGSHAQFSCEVGFVLNGPSLSNCTSSGTWRRPFPTCSVVDCGNLSVSGGQVNGNNATYNSMVSLTCDVGRYLLGPAISRCQSNGTWSQIGQCNSVVCPSLSLLNGTVTGTNLTFGSKVTFFCNLNFFLMGSASATCQQDGQWQFDAPKHFQPYCYASSSTRNTARPTSHSQQLNTRTNKASKSTSISKSSMPSTTKVSTSSIPKSSMPSITYNSTAVTQPVSVTSDGKPQNAAGKQSKSFNAGLILGVSVGGTVVLVTASLILFMCIRKRKRTAQFASVSKETASLSHTREVVFDNAAFSNLPLSKADDVSPTYLSPAGRLRDNESYCSSSFPTNGSHGCTLEANSTYTDLIDRMVSDSTYQATDIYNQGYESAHPRRSPPTDVAFLAHKGVTSNDGTDKGLSLYEPIQAPSSASRHHSTKTK